MWKQVSVGVYSDGTEPSGPSCDSLCLGLAVGLVLGVVLIVVVIVVVVVAWQRGCLRPGSSPLYSTAAASTDALPNTTVIRVNSRAGYDGYCRPESVLPSPDRDTDSAIYLHLDDRPVADNVMDECK